MGDTMSFKEDMQSVINNFIEQINVLQVSITEYNNSFEAEKENYRDAKLLKERMLDTFNKAVFVSELTGSDKFDVHTINYEEYVEEEDGDTNE